MGGKYSVPSKVPHEAQAVVTGPGAAEGPAYKHGQPAFDADQVVKYFDQGNGLLFRCVNTASRQWAFYNDTKKFEMHVTVRFGPQSSIRPLGTTTIATLPESGMLQAQVVVYPKQTELFIEGEPTSYEVTAEAVLLTTEYVEQRRREKKEAKKREKEEAKRQAGGGAAAADAEDDLGEDVQPPASHGSHPVPIAAA